MTTGEGATRAIRRRIRLTRQTKLATLASAILVVSALILGYAPVPFVTWSPGSAYNLLSTTGGRPTVDVSNTPVYASHGQLLLLTVAQPQRDALVSLPEALLAFWRPNHAVFPREVIYPNGASAKTDSDARALSMTQEEAVAAALRAAGRTVVAMPVVSQVTSSGPANSLLQPGDFITAVDSVPTTTPDAVYRELQKKAVGGKTTVAFLRNGVPGQAVIPVVAANTDKREPVIGATFVTGYSHSEKVTLNLDQEIVGTSGGLMYALAIYDRLTAHDLPAGRVISGTGQIEVDGRLSAVGGIPEKLAAAEAAHASIFIVPASNCGDLVTTQHTLRIVKANTLADAITALHDLETPGSPAAAAVPSC